jgi:transposase-like protein
MHPPHHRTYTLAFKLQVIRACLEDHQAVRAVARQFAVDHSLVRYWLRRYDGGGEAALRDRRGRPDPRPPRRVPAGLSVAEENAWLKAENAYLKKVWARERGDDRGTDTR